MFMTDSIEYYADQSSDKPETREEMLKISGMG